LFCPNCGTENDDAATTCKKCGFNLKGAAAPKFKGTMLMMNTPPAQPRPPGAAPGAPTPAPGAVTVQGHGGPGAAPAPGAGGPAPRPALKGTMLGVAPPSLGANSPGGAPPGVPPAAQPGSPFGPTPAQAFGAQPAPMPMHGNPPPGAVNPLGGTMVADPAGVGFNPYGQGGGPYGAPPGAPPQQQPPAYGAPPAHQGYGGPAPGGGGFGAPPEAAGQPPGGFPPPGGGFGAPPPGQGGFGAPPPGGGFGAPPPGGGYGSPPPGGGFGAPPGGGYGAPQGGFGAPQQPGGYGGTPSPGGYGAPQGGYGGPGAAPIVPSPGGRGPIGKTRNPVMVLVIGALCFVYALIQFWGMLNELKAFRGKDDINPILFFVPILGIIQMWNLPPKILEAKQMAGVPNAQVGSPILYLFLALYLLPADLNEIWQAAGGGQPR
jgi:hypothetical protein